MLSKLETIGIKFKSGEFIFTKKTINKLTEKFIKKVECSFMNEIVEKFVKQNLSVTNQLGNNCYLVAAIEMLLSSFTFIRFLLFYSSLQKIDSDVLSFANIEFTICKELKYKPPIEFCCLLLSYVQKKYQKNFDAVNIIYKKLEEMINKEMGYPVGEQENLGNVLEYLQRSFLFSLLFSFRRKVECSILKMNFWHLITDHIIKILILEKNLKKNP